MKLKVKLKQHKKVEEKLILTDIRINNETNDEAIHTQKVKYDDIDKLADRFY